MITEFDLQEQIAKIQGMTTPTSNDCVKLAAYITILNSMKADADGETRSAPDAVKMQYSSAEPPQNTIEYSFECTVLNALNGREINEMCEFTDELMQALYTVNPELYRFAVRRLKE